MTKEFVENYDLAYTNGLTEKINKKLSLNSKIKKMGSSQKFGYSNGKYPYENRSLRVDQNIGLNKDLFEVKDIQYVDEVRQN